LQGTNTAERQIASRRVLRHLTTTSALGAVSSHDLTLIGDSSLAASAAPAHFSEQFDEREGVAGMTFDYQLRPGLATSTNALALMELLGFPENDRD
jgi:DNA mismatch repair ATPase MutS